MKFKQFLKEIRIKQPKQSDVRKAEEDPDAINPELHVVVSEKWRDLKNVDENWVIK